MICTIIICYFEIFGLFIVIKNKQTLTFLGEKKLIYNNEERCLYETDFLTMIKSSLHWNKEKLPYKLLK